jgi:nudix-type nucleoside diphosphatase (YffH/AdpP family)
MDRTFRILSRHEVFRRSIFRIEEVTLEFTRFDSSLSGEVTRLILDRGDSVALLLYDRSNEIVLLCEQFRAPTYRNGSGWLLELPAGMLESGESAEECARREAMEETGFSVQLLRRIGYPYLSPGGSSERIHIFYSEVSLKDRLGKGGGVVSEQEDIRIVGLPIDEAFAMVRDGQILDAKTLVALQWLELERLRQRTREA